MKFDALELTVMANAFAMIAEEMGTVLVRGALSPNIRERRDASAALFDASGRMVAQAAHIPVHLGAMPESVRAVRACNPKPGDVFLLNDPYEGGSHLPDLTLVQAIGGARKMVGFSAVRAHHADVGGMSPGSMPQGATELVQAAERLLERDAFVLGFQRHVELVPLPQVPHARERRTILGPLADATLFVAKGWRARLVDSGAWSLKRA